MSNRTTSSSQSSTILDHSSSSLGIGDFVASGIGIQSSSSGFSSQTSAATSSAVNSRLQAPSNVSSTTYNNLTSFRSFNDETTIPAAASAVYAGNFTGNNTLNGDQCWTQWSSFWSANASIDTVRTTLGTGGTTFFTTTGTNYITYSSEPASTTTITSVQSITRTLGANGFTDSVQTAVVSTTWTETMTSPYSHDSTETIVYTLTSVDGPSYTEITPKATLPTPRCSLPSSVPQCESQWQTYESGLVSLVQLSQEMAACPDVQTGTCSASSSARNSALMSLRSLSSHPPYCAQASLAPSFCSTLRDNYVSSWLENNWEYGPGWLGSVGYATSYSTFQNGSRATTEFWPTSSSIGPGCSLGCARCAITGGTVQLIYWPVTERPNGTVPLTASALDTIFTYPTVYISYNSIYASDSCSGVGTALGRTILALPQSSVLSSVWADYPDDTAPQTAFFNFTDLNTPVPRSIFDRQPQCAAYSKSLWSNPYQDIIPGKLISGYDRLATIFIINSKRNVVPDDDIIQANL